MTSKIAYIPTLASIYSLKEYICNENFNYAILENIDEIVFEKFSDKFTFDAWDKGRLFGEKSELKWIKRKGTYHMVLITDGAVPGNFVTYRVESIEEGPLRQIYLWGEKNTDTKTEKDVEGWYDPKIPKILKYPVDDYKSASKYLKMMVKTYKLAEKQEVYRKREWLNKNLVSEIYRYVGLEGK